MDKEKKDSAEEPELTYTVQGDTFAGSWAPPATSAQPRQDSTQILRMNPN